MKILKGILIAVVIIIAIPLIVALFVSKDYAVEREVVIHKPNSIVFDYIRQVKNQDSFSIWNMKDPNMKKQYKGTDGTVGFIYSWESTHAEVGTGEQEIVGITEGKRMDAILRFKVPWETEGSAHLSTEMVDSNFTKVKWGFTGEFPYPFNLMRLFVNMDKELGKDLDAGLANLKRILGKQ